MPANPGHDDKLILNHSERLTALEGDVEALTGRMDRHTADNQRDFNSMRDNLTTMLSIELKALNEKVDTLVHSVQNNNDQMWKLIRVLVAVLIILVLTYIGLRELAPKILGAM
jgi:hypothetical protein